MLWNGKVGRYRLIVFKKVKDYLCSICSLASSIHSILRGFSFSCSQDLTVLLLLIKSGLQKNPCWNLILRPFGQFLFLLVVGFSFFERGLLLDLGAKITRSTGQYNGNGRVDSGFLKKDISCRIHATAYIPLFITFSSGLVPHFTEEFLVKRRQ